MSRIQPLCRAVAAWFVFASALTALGAAPPPQHVGESPANEATVVRLPDDSLRIYYIVQPARTELRSIGSSDHGKTWGDDRLEFTLPGNAYYANQVLVDTDGELHAAFHIQTKGDNGHNGRHYDVWHAKTSGGRKAWGKPQRIFEGYVGSMRSFAQLKSGRLLVPVAIAIPSRSKKPDAAKPDYGWNDVVVFYSDDKGATWQRTPKQLSVLQDNARGRTRYGAVEPHVVELSPGRVWMLIRTKNGFLYESFSSDGVEWSDAKPSKFISSDSPATAARLKDGRLTLFINACQRWDDPMSYAIGGREVLHGAISADDGATWQGFRDVLYDFAGNAKGDRGTAYPSAAQAADGAIVLVSGQGEGRKSILRIDPDWLAETSATSSFAKDAWPRWTSHEGKGTEIIDHPDKPGDKCLAVRQTDANAMAGATWNFPMAPAGKLVLRIKPGNDFDGAVISLTDHYAVTGDTKADQNAVYSVRLDARSVAAGKWHDVTFEWKPGGDATVTIDGAPAPPIKAKRRPSFGVNYVRVSSGDEAGFFIESATASASPAGATAAVSPPRTLTLVALGDSITKGARPARGGAAAVAADETFAALLQAELADAGMAARVINSGVGGNRADQGLARLEADVLAHKPDVVTIMFGTNDSCYDDGKAAPRLSAAQFESNLREIVTRCQAAGAKPILMTAPPLTTKWPLATKQPVYRERGVNGPLATFMEVTRRAAWETGVPFVDHFSTWSAKPTAEVESMLPDGCHPNAAGHKALAAAILPVVLAQAQAPPREAKSSDVLTFTKRRGSGTGGCVLDVGAPGGFDQSWVTCPTVLRQGDAYRMWYSSYYNAQWGDGRMGLATSKDGLTWTRQHGQAPLLGPGREGAFDDALVFGPEVLHDGKQYLMWYTGDANIKHASGIYHYQIGLATSPDGVAWTRANGGEAVIDNGPEGSYDQVQSATPSVLRDGDGYRMWYAAWAPNPNHTICVARSADGVTWERERGGKPVEGLRPSIAYGHAVARVGDRYVMLYMALEAPRGLFAAVSDDGTRWRTLNDGRPVISPGSAGDFDENLLGHPHLMVEGDTLRCWYTGYQTKPGGIGKWELRIGLAEASLKGLRSRGEAR